MDQEIESQEDEILVQIPETNLMGVNIICRLCANPNERIIGIYSDEGISNDLATKMNTYLPVKVAETDSLPLQCCWNCASTVLAWHELVVASIEADRRLRDIQLSDKQVASEDEYSCIEEPTTPIDDRLNKEKEVVETTGFVKEADQETRPPQPSCIKQENFHCSICNLTLSNENLLNLHQYKEHAIGELQVDKDGRVCKICKSTFGRRSDMLRHIKRQHTEKSIKTIKPTRRRCRLDIEYGIFCDICNMGFTRVLDMKKHKVKQHPDVVDKMLHICDICNKRFDRKVQLNKHLKEDHNQKTPRFRRQKSDIIAEHFCDICNKGFTRKYDMQKHRNSKHPNEPKPTKEPITQQQKNLQLLEKCKVPGDDNKTYYKCEVCDRLFRQSYNFVRHQTVHTGVRAFFCHICGKNFRVSGGLYRHITEHHYGVKKYECDVCGKSFAAKATRDDHKNIHTNNRPFICDMCGKAFRQKASLHIHKLFHGDNYRFSCNICDKKYRRASELKIHSWLHTGHKPHQCTICEARFRLRQDLKRHIKIHDKLNECVCKECGSTFRQERYLKNHIKTHRVKIFIQSST